MHREFGRILALGLAVYCAAFISLAASADNLILIGVSGGDKAAAPAGYQGPGDISSGALAWYSTGRAYNAAYAAAQSPLVDLVDTTTGLAACTLNVGTNGYANLTAVVCPTGAPVVSVTTFCTVTHVGCSITKEYDQTANGLHVTQATLAKMPLLTLSALNGLPCGLAASGSTTTILTSSGSISSTAAPYSRTMVTERVANFTTANYITAVGAGSGNYFLLTNTPNTIDVSNGTAAALTAADSAPHALLTVASSTDPLFAADSSSNTNTNTNGTTAMSGVVNLYNRGSGNLSNTALICEMGIWPSDLNSVYTSQLANMRSATVGWNF